MKKNRFSQFGEGLCRDRLNKITGGSEGKAPKRQVIISFVGKVDTRRQ